MTVQSSSQLRAGRQHTASRAVVAKSLVAQTKSTTAAIAKLDKVANRIHEAFDGEQTFTTAQAESLVASLSKMAKQIDVALAGAYRSAKQATAMELPSKTICAQVEDLSTLRGKVALLHAQVTASIESEEELLQIDENGFVVEEEEDLAEEVSNEIADPEEEEAVEVEAPELEEAEEAEEVEEVVEEVSEEIIDEVEEAEEASEEIVEETEELAEEAEEIVEEAVEEVDLDSEDAVAEAIAEELGEEDLVEEDLVEELEVSSEEDPTEEVDMEVEEVEEELFEEASEDDFVDELDLPESGIDELLEEEILSEDAPLDLDDEVQTSSASIQSRRLASATATSGGKAGSAEDALASLVEAQILNM